MCGIRSVVAVWAAVALWQAWVPAAHAAAAKSKYVEDLGAFLAEMDKTYPFFDVKDLRKGWAPFKSQLAKKAKACANDQQFLGLVVDTISYLRDGHMGIAKTEVKFPPAEPEWYPGVSFMPATENRVIVMTAPAKFAAQLKPGVVVTQIDGKPARAFLEAKTKEAWDKGGSFSSHQRARLFEYRIALRGKKGEQHKLTVLAGKKSETVAVACVEEAKGWPHTYHMPANLTAHGRTCLYGKLESGLGYLYLRNIDNDTEAGLAAAIAALTDVKGFIVDLRGNGGGGYDQALTKRVEGLKQPVAVLIDAGCVSAGETFARDLVRIAKATLLGQTTAGSSSSKRQWTFPSGIATLSLPEASRKGLVKDIEFNGIAPHVAVEPVPEEVARGVNSEILRAEELLLKGGAPTKSGAPKKGAK